MKNNSLIIGMVALIGLVGIVLMLKGTTGFVAASGLKGTTYRVSMTAEQSCVRFTSQDGTRYIPAYQNGHVVINRAMNLVKCVPGGIHQGAENQEAYDDEHAIWSALDTTGRGGSGYGTQYSIPYW